MELRQLSTFIQVAQLKSFSRAAESLGYSQSAVTVQIRQLEEELDTRLFDRIGKHISLTARGVQFLEHAYDVLQEVNKARLSVSDTGPASPFRTPGSCTDGSTSGPLSPCASPSCPLRCTPIGSGTPRWWSMSPPANRSF